VSTAARNKLVGPFSDDLIDDFVNLQGPATIAGKWKSGISLEDFAEANVIGRTIQVPERHVHL
jgi:hypothetical protein